jgi:hypothetical protein
LSAGYILLMLWERQPRAEALSSAALARIIQGKKN